MRGHGIGGFGPGHGRTTHDDGGTTAYAAFDDTLFAYEARCLASRAACCTTAVTRKARAASAAAQVGMVRAFACLKCEDEGRDNERRDN